MKNTINSTLKIALVTALFCSAAFADGDMGAGGKTCTQNCSSFADTGNGTGGEIVDPANTNDVVDDTVLVVIETVLAQLVIK